MLLFLILMIQNFSRAPASNFDLQFQRVITSRSVMTFGWRLAQMRMERDKRQVASSICLQTARWRLFLDVRGSHRGLSTLFVVLEIQIWSRSKSLTWHIHIVFWELYDAMRCPKVTVSIRKRRLGSGIGHWLFVADTVLYSWTLDSEQKDGFWPDVQLLNTYKLECFTYICSWTAIKRTGRITDV